VCGGLLELVFQGNLSDQLLRTQVEKAHLQTKTKTKQNKKQKQPAHPNFFRVYKFLIRPDSTYCENLGRFH